MAFEEFYFLRDFSSRCVDFCPPLVQEEGCVDKIGRGN